MSHCLQQVFAKIHGYSQEISWMDSKNWCVPFKPISLQTYLKANLGGGFKYFLCSFLGKRSNLTSIFFKRVETFNHKPEIVRAIFCQISRAGNLTFPTIPKETIVFQHIPTIHFQGRTVSFREGISLDGRVTHPFTTQEFLSEFAKMFSGEKEGSLSAGEDYHGMTGNSLSQHGMFT